MCKKKGGNSAYHFLEISHQAEEIFSPQNNGWCHRAIFPIKSWFIPCCCHLSPACVCATPDPANHTHALHVPFGAFGSLCVGRGEKVNREGGRVKEGERE